MARTARIVRETSESHIELELNLDDTGKTDIDTSVPFYNHMMTALGKHSLIDLTIHAHGDTDIDAHHTVEDTAIVFGEALKQALGDKRGIRRFADATVPLDEALAKAVVDISGRPWLEWRGDELLPPVLAGEERDVWREFYKSFAAAARMNVHVAFLYGRNGHHLLESAAKGLGLALAQAASLTGNVVRSTKGSLD